MTVHFADIAWSDSPRYWLANARVPVCLLANPTISADSDDEGVVSVDVLVEGDGIARIAPTQDARDDRIARVDLGGRQVWPTLIDVHTHLDKGHSIKRNPNND